MPTHQLDPRDPEFRKYGHGNIDSAVIGGYKIVENGIMVKFAKPSKSGTTTYLYTEQSAGEKEIESMKTLAEANDGFLTYINQNVRKKFAEKW